jgi:hypothetical protein
MDKSKQNNTDLKNYTDDECSKYKEKLIHICESIINTEWFLQSDPYYIRKQAELFSLKILIELKCKSDLSTQRKNE